MGQSITAFAWPLAGTFWQNPYFLLLLSHGILTPLASIIPQALQMMLSMEENASIANTKHAYQINLIIAKYPPFSFLHELRPRSPRNLELPSILHLVSHIPIEHELSDFWPSAKREDLADCVQTFGDVRPGGFADAEDLCTKSTVSGWMAKVCYGDIRKFGRLTLVSTTLMRDLTKGEGVFCCFAARLKRSITWEP